MKQTFESKDSPGDTRSRLLDAAERLFAAQTYRATSLRQITGEAGANVASVHYHFGSKDELFQAVFHRRVGPVNDDRLRRLRLLTADESQGPPPLESILHALVEPAVALRARPEGRSFACLIGRSLAADGPHWKTLRREFDGIRAQFIPALSRACPHLSPADLAWRLHFTLASLCMVLSDTDRLGRASNGLCDPDDVTTVVKQLVAFAAAGLRAPAAERGGDSLPTDSTALENDR